MQEAEDGFWELGVGRATAHGGRLQSDKDVLALE